MEKRIIGFDLARAFAIFGMIVVNYNVALGNLKDTSWLGQVLHEFSGNASATFVLLAGIGLTLMAYKPNLPKEEQNKLKRIVFKRSLFLFVLGLLLYPIWSADILHFYGAYMKIGLLFLYASSSMLIGGAVFFIVGFVLLSFFLDYQTGWQWATFTYTDFWTLQGFLRNTFFNGWNPIFPWVAFYLFGMYLGRLDWHNPKIRQNLWIVSSITFLSVEIITRVGKQILPTQNEWYMFFDITTQIPPLPFYILSSASLSIITILIAVWVGKALPNNLVIKSLQFTGQLSLTHYLAHILLGIVGFLVIFHPELTTQENILQKIPYSPLFILLYVLGWFISLAIFSYIWRKHYKQGIIENFMRKLTD